MNWKVFKLKFTEPLHLGYGRLDDSGFIIHSDTLFSALCLEMLKIRGQDGINALITEAKNNRLFISDCLPYMDGEFYLPKPIAYIETDEERYGSKKEFKKLKYIPLSLFGSYVAGSLDAAAELEKFSGLGRHWLKTSVSLRGNALGLDAEPYSVEMYSFSDNAGLYVLAGYDKAPLDCLMDSLSYSGIGGRRSAGCGRFSLTEESAAPFLLRLNNDGARRRMTLNLSYPAKDEADKAMESATYSVMRRAGFVQSAGYAQSPMKKRDFYALSTGSVFVNTFSGDVFDVSSGGSHPVWKYMKPLFWEVD